MTNTFFRQFEQKLFLKKHKFYNVYDKQNSMGFYCDV